jgi:glycine cleavage system transcriptional repressor
MTTNIVFTLTGPDRVGLVEEVTRAMLRLDGNVETSRAVRLGGEFAILMLVTLPAESADALDEAFAHLTSGGYRITVGETDESYEQAYHGWKPYRVEVNGADHEGIIHDIAHGLSTRGINIESMDTETTAASVSGAPLFHMTALVMVPPTLDESAWVGQLEEAAAQANVDVSVKPAEPGA